MHKKVYSLQQNQDKRCASHCSKERIYDLKSYIKVIVFLALLLSAFTQMGWVIAGLETRVSDTTAVIEYLKDRFEMLQNVFAKHEKCYKYFPLYFWKVPSSLEKVFMV